MQAHDSRLNHTECLVEPDDPHLNHTEPLHNKDSCTLLLLLLVQVKRMVGRHGLSGVRGLWQNVIDLVTVQGSHRCENCV